MKICSRPDCRLAGVPQDESAFNKSINNADGLRYECRECDNAAQRAGRRARIERRRAAAGPVASPVKEALEPAAAGPVASPVKEALEPAAVPAEVARAQKAEAERVRRLESPYESLGFANFKAAQTESQARDAGYTQPGAGPLGASDPEADKQKKQEYNLLMGRTADFLRDPSTFDDKEIRELALYHAHLAEDEQRFMNRRAARAVSLHLSREALARREWKLAIKEHLQGKIEASGYATRPHTRVPLERTLCVHLSDIHLGSDLDSKANPMQYRALEEARRLEYVLRNVLDYKRDHREQTELLLMLNGDLIEGQLGHDGRAGAPGAEQRLVFLKLFGPFLAHCARAFKKVRVVCTPGNHGRDIVRHPGRALVDKWDGIESTLYEMLRVMCSELRNVTFHIPGNGVAIIGLYGKRILQAHADTEPSISDPDSGANKNTATLLKASSNRTYGHEFHAAVFGHFHKGRFLDKTIAQIFGPALVPPNTFGRVVGGTDEKQGQVMWEATPGHLIGDLRVIEVGTAQDTDERLGRDLIKPFRFARDDHGLYSGTNEVA